MTEGSIIRNFDIDIIDLPGEIPFVFNGNSLTVRRAIQLAFFNSCRGDENDPDGSVDRYRIGTMLTHGGNIAFTPDDLTKIRQRVRRFWTASMISGQIEAIIDKKE